MTKRSVIWAWRNTRLVLNIPRLLPHLLFWRFSSNRELIDQDVRRWRDAFLAFLGGISLSRAFVTLMVRYPEFRPLFYHRIGLSSGLIRFLCPPPDTFQLMCDDLGPGLIIQHGLGSIIVAKKIGKNCWINQQVTLGGGPRPGFPTLGDDVRIAPGAKVLGAVRIGDRSIVGANAVVTKDVPPDVTVVGVPAYIMRRDGQRVHEPL